MFRIDILLEYRERFANWKSVIIKMLLKKYPITCLLHEGENLIIYNHKQLEMARAGFIFEFSPVKRILSFIFMEKKINLFDSDYNGDVLGVFYKQEYSNLNVDNKLVIDIGANIGDSAIYFAIKGAKEVIALEPYPSTFQSLKENVRVNGYADKIRGLNAGYGKDGYIKVNPQRKTIGATSLSPDISGLEVPLFSLQTIVDNYCIEEAILKMDCEGCEYALLDEDPRYLAPFSEIEIEYHYGYEKLVNFLKKCGYNVTYTDPVNYFNIEAQDPDMKLGLIIAKK
jgi:FkbM family methyltransferase